ncbi:MAG: metallophosphoesterase [Candidatus Omnitrophica bacterium]|nr:metallophosphoesterase [Candidatus Omnitrophota bacterium]
MKYVVISDIHGNLPALEAAVSTFPEESEKNIICAGDIVGYGAEPGKCIEKVRALGARSVMGNHDAGVIGRTDISYFNNAAAEAVRWTRKQLNGDGLSYLEKQPYVIEEKFFSVAHGTLHDPERFSYMMTGADAMHTFEVLKTKICFVGHSHVPGTFILREGKLTQTGKNAIVLEDNASYIVNVGSIGQPRDGDNRACYCIYDADKGQIDLRRIEYDISLAAERIAKAGLPQVLADRLFIGS